MHTLIRTFTHQMVSSKSVLRTELRTFKRRKPRWLPMAKTKLYKTRELPKENEDEIEQMKELDARNMVYIRSLLAFEKTIFDKKLAIQASEDYEHSEEAELSKIVQANDRYNHLVRTKRESQLHLEWKDMERQIVSEKESCNQEEAKRLEQTQEAINIQLERLKAAIKFEDLDIKIEQCLVEEIDYSFAIDEKGKLYGGRFNSRNPGEHIFTLQDDTGDPNDFKIVHVANKEREKS